jgi:hypothetical protein
MFYPTKVRRKNIFCIESHWGGTLIEPKPSVRPILEFCSVARGTKYSHQIVHTEGEFEYAIGNANPKTSNLLFLAFHGKADNIYLGANQEFTLTVDDIADMMGTRFSGSGLHFSSCSVLNIAEQKIHDFMKRTGLSFVSGYSQGIDYIESGAMDLAFLGKWYNYKSVGHLHNAIVSSYGDLIDENQFRFYRGR